MDHTQAGWKYSLPVHKLIPSLSPLLSCLPDTPCCSLSLSLPALWMLPNSLVQDAAPGCLLNPWPSMPRRFCRWSQIRSPARWMMSSDVFRGHAVGRTCFSLTWAPANSLCPPQNHQQELTARSFSACIVLQGDPHAGRVNYTNSRRNYIGPPLA